MKIYMHLLSGFHHFSDFPKRIWSLFLRKFGRSRIFSQDNSTSDSDSTDYTDFIQAVNENSSLFKKFRTNYVYRQILEHVTYQQGMTYFEKLSERHQSKLAALPNKNLSLVGSPRTYHYKRLGSISPTMIRYEFVSQEIERIFGPSIGSEIVEIGVGFGGQYAVLEKSFSFSSYRMFDLPEVMLLVRKVLSSAEVRIDKILDGDINSPRVAVCDLVISNYAFSELPRDIQKQYLEGVMRVARRGYLTMNSGRTNKTGRSDGKYSLDELKTLLPPFEVFEEVPLTGDDNYLIVWGHKQ
jgi:hypothetical protein